MLAKKGFDDIRPYLDHEVPEVIKRIADKPSLVNMMEHVFPPYSISQTLAELKQVSTVYQFQKKFVHKLFRSIIGRSIKDLTIHGIENVEPDLSYIFICNHRDIVLDPAILNVAFFEEGLDTTHIAIGDNLLFSNLVNDLLRLNKSFVVNRDLQGQEMYHHSMHLSRYIRKTVVEDNSSVWIAQRNGRTKDGNDYTQTGLLKMLQMSTEKAFEEGFEELRIVPMAISYEYEPCDLLKAEEAFKRSKNGDYVKTVEEDKAQMIEGIMQQKGNVHIAFGEPIKEELKSVGSIVNKNERFRQFALFLDKQISNLYKIWPIHFAAADMLYESETYASHYSPLDRATMERYLAQKLKSSSIQDETMKDFLLQIYANPVTNKKFAPKKEEGRL